MFFLSVSATALPANKGGGERRESKAQGLKRGEVHFPYLTCTKHIDQSCMSSGKNNWSREIIGVGSELLVICV